MATLNEIYYGNRGEEFKQVILSFLRKGNLKTKYINFLTNDENMVLYGHAFTSDTVDTNNNYEIYEQLGDLSANKFIVSYAYKVYPQLSCPQGVPVVAQLRIRYGAKKTFFQIGETLGLWDYISASVEERNSKKKDLLEDCFEAIIGVTEFILDNFYRPGVGYGIVYDILTTIFNEMPPMSLEYNELKTSKTRLKEMFDKHQIGELEYITREDKTKHLHTVTIYQVPNVAERCKYCCNKYPNKETLNMHVNVCPVRLSDARTWIMLGVGTAAKKKDAETKAADIAFNKLSQRFHINDSYLTFCKK
jgi:dsRNA-specific ribonuclease